MKRIVVVLLSAIMIGGVICQNEQCDTAELDPFDMAQMDIYPTADLENDIPEELVVKQLEVGKEEGGEALKAIAEGASQFQADVEAGDVDIDTYVGDTASVSNQLISKYVWTCPVLWRFVNNLRWYFSSGNKICWSYYPIAVAICPLRHCGLSASFHPIFSVYYRCFPNYRTIFIYARCVERRDGNFVWSSMFIRHVVSRGCSCRRYYRYYLRAADTCSTDENLDIPRP